MIRFVDFKLALGEVIIDNDVIEDEAGWEKGQIELKTGIIKRFTTSESSEYLAYEAIKKIKADIIYLDPPYTGTMNDYFSFYGLIDNYFISKKNKRFKNSFIDKKESIKNFEKLFSRLKKFKYCFLSYNNQSYPTKEDLLKILKNNFKKVNLVEKKHNYQITGKNKKGTNTEFLFIIKNE